MEEKIRARYLQGSTSTIIYSMPRVPSGRHIHLIDDISWGNLRIKRLVNIMGPLYSVYLYTWSLSLWSLKTIEQIRTKFEWTIMCNFSTLSMKVNLKASFRRRNIWASEVKAPIGDRHIGVVTNCRPNTITAWTHYAIKYQQRINQFNRAPPSTPLTKTTFNL